MRLIYLFFLASIIFSCNHKSAISTAQPPVITPPPVLKKEKTPDSLLVKTGLENFVQNYVHLVKGKRVGLVTNPSGVDRNLKSTADIFYEHPEINLTALYGPEHGIRGAIHAGWKVEDEIDPLTGLPIFSLYGKTYKPTDEMLEPVDVLFVDIQDIGIRSYTYIYTMAKVLEAAAENDKEVIVLDRPNPINGVTVEGNIVQEEFYSFVGLYPLVYRHGMTIGELANLFNFEYGLDAKLTVIPMINWKREMHWNETALPWVPTSPHVPHWHTIIPMIATGTVGELLTVSNGVGYTSPFEQIGAPWINADDFARELNSYNLDGIIFRPLYFRPYYATFKEEICQGVQLHVTDPYTFKPFVAGIYILQALIKLYPEQDLFGKGNRVTMFNKVMGNSEITNALQDGVDAKEMEKRWQKELSDFLAIRQKYLLY